MIQKIRKNPEVAKRMVLKVVLVAPKGSVIYRFPQTDDSAQEELKAVEEAGAVGRFMHFIDNLE